VSLRRAEPADASAIRELSRAAYNQVVRRHIIDLHEERGELRALIEMGVETGHLLIENIAVRPDQQGKGIGDRLLRHVEAVATSLDLREIQLYANAAFISNLAFYAKRGYQEYDRKTMPSGRTAVFMRKTLLSSILASHFLTSAPSGLGVVS
jgi:N-acetylglutamate synthase-like GNAT family acetyltransferase